MGYFMFNCNEAVEVCNKSQYNNASKWEQFRYKLHVLICKACKTYTKKNNKLTALISSAEINVLDNDTKEAFQELINQKLKAQNGK